MTINGHTVAVQTYEWSDDVTINAVDGVDVAGTAPAREAERRLRSAAGSKLAAVEAKAKTFRVGDRADTVTRELGHAPYPEQGGTFRAKSRDGRTATGYVADGEWVATTIGDHTLPSGTVEGARIGREAREQYQRQHPDKKE